MTDIVPNPRDRKKADREVDPGMLVPLGSWWWLRVDAKESSTDPKGKKEVLTCAVKLGSNFVELHTVHNSYWRLHLDDEFPDVARPCPNPREVIEREIKSAQETVSHLMAKVQDVTKEIGVQAGHGDRKEVGTALATLSGQEDPDAYKKALVKAKEKTLPALFEEIKSTTEIMKTWMKAELMPLRAMVDKAKEVTKEIEGRIFNVEIYAGLAEEVKVVKEGEPAPATEKLHVFQNMLYMDEECLADYEAGGMDFQKTKEFDRWLTKPENFARVLPFPRTLVAMRIRRFAKDRSGDSSYGDDALSTFIKFKHEEFDKKTFLYVRNGARLYRIDSQMEFGSLIFPSKDEFSAEPMMFKRDGDTVRFRTVREHEALQAKEKARAEAEATWARENPWWRYRIHANREARIEWKKERAEKRAKRLVRRLEAHGKTRKVKHTFSKNGKITREEIETIDRAKEVHQEQAERPIDHWHEDHWLKERWREKNPHHRNRDFDVFRESWEPFDKASVHYDEAQRVLEKQLKEWNRTVLVIQGLYDRSECLQPHPVVQLWDPEGFKDAIEPVYDGANVLHVGEAPSFEAYRAKLAESLTEGSFTIGQERIWLDREQEKEQARRDASSRDEGPVRKWWKPSGDPGPGFVARIVLWRRNAHEAVFRWKKERQKRLPRWKRWEMQSEGKEVTNEIACAITVPASDLFNASAYKPGDYLRFFRDPRTRRDYVKWAPYLLSAEDWKAGMSREQDAEISTSEWESIQPVDEDEDQDDEDTEDEAATDLVLETDDEE